MSVRRPTSTTRGTALHHAAMLLPAIDKWHIGRQSYETG